MIATKTSIKRSYPNFLIIIAAIIISLGIFWLIIHEVITEKEEAIDQKIMNFISQYVNPKYTTIMADITFLGSRDFLITAYLFLISLFLIKKQKYTALKIALIGTIGFSMVEIFKNIFHRHRPLHPLISPLNNYSFPSGHTTSGFIFYGLLIHLLWQTKISSFYKWILSIFFFVISILIGLSRIYLNMHFPSDVAAGFCLGFAWLVMAIFLFDKAKSVSPPALIRNTRNDKA